MTSKEIIKQIIVKLEDDLQHYTMVDIDKVKAKYIELEIEDYKQVLQDLERLETLEKIFSDSHICEIQARFNEIECSTEKCNNCPLGFESGVCLKNTFETKWKLQQENEKLKKIKTNIENKIKFIESCIVKQELNGNEVAIFNLKWQIDLLKEVLRND